MMVEVKIKDLIAEQISGEWGNEPKKGEGVFVIRTTNFQNDGKLNLEDIVKRDIPEKKIVAKRLQKGDVIIEKSGGSPDQPVGRVVFFNEDSGEPYLTNNFTTILRPNIEKVNPLYFYYLMMRNYQIKKVLKFQNKTTGIINLKLEKYLNSKVKIHKDPNEQIFVCTLLARLDKLIENRETSIQLLDEFILSNFLSIFGDPVLNTKGFDLVPLSTLGKLDRGVSKHRPRNAKELLGGKYPLIQTGEVRRSKLFITEYTNTYSELGLKQSKLWASGTLCISIAANIAQTSILAFDACFPDSVVGFIPKKGKSNVFYVHYLFDFLQSIIEARAPKAAQMNINLDILRNLRVPKPSMTLQNRFKQIVEKYVENLKELDDSAILLNEIKESLFQKSYRGEFPTKEVNIEHIIPKHVGGTSDFSNLTISPKLENKAIIDETFSSFDGSVESEDLESLTGINYAWPPRESEEEINELLGELDNELKYRKEVPCVAEYIKYRIIKEKLSKTFAFEDLWEAIENTPFVEHPTYDMLRNWIFEEISSNKMTQKLDGRGGKKKLKLQLI